MTTLAETFDRLIDENDLCSISVDRMVVHGSADTWRVWGSNAHWMEHGSMRCLHGTGDTPEQAIAQAISKANSERGRCLDVPATIEMGEAVQERGAELADDGEGGE